MDNGKMITFTPKNIRNEIEKLLQDRFELPEDYVSGNEEDNFFGLRHLLAPRELTYLVYMIEQRYGIQFSMKEYDEPKFYCLSGLSEIVTEMIREQSGQEVMP